MEEIPMTGIRKDGSRRPCPHAGFPTRQDQRAKLRLFACACCRLIWPLLAEPAACVESWPRSIVPRDGRPCRLHGRRTCRPRVWATRRRCTPKSHPFSQVAATPSPRHWWPPPWPSGQTLAVAAAPLRPTSWPTSADARTRRLDRRCRTSEVQALAKAISDQRRFQDLPRLADLLETAGCPPQNLLDHCRSGGSHVLGCWALDLLLGKS